mmetsp:Transcript_8652/g.31900  ORF Transcript_8652/g.31900 Transcript_8652/m.31900 type:complete len:251 (+) Transcript_8652:3012-3764(+)
MRIRGEERRHVLQRVPCSGLGRRLRVAARHQRAPNATEHLEAVAAEVVVTAQRLLAVGRTRWRRRNLHLQAWHPKRRRDRGVGRGRRLLQGGAVTGAGVAVVAPAGERHEVQARSQALGELAAVARGRRQAAFEEAVPRTVLFFCRAVVALAVLIGGRRPRGPHNRGQGEVHGDRGGCGCGGGGRHGWCGLCPCDLGGCRGRLLRRLAATVGGADAHLAAAQPHCRGRLEPLRVSFSCLLCLCTNDQSTL